jgi:hypothetical protein
MKTPRQTDKKKRSREAAQNPHQRRRVEETLWNTVALQLTGRVGLCSNRTHTETNYSPGIDAAQEPYCTYQRAEIDTKSTLWISYVYLF